MPIGESQPFFVEKIKYTLSLSSSIRFNVLVHGIFSTFIINESTCYYYIFDFKLFSLTQFHTKNVLLTCLYIYNNGTEDAVNQDGETYTWRQR